MVRAVSKLKITFAGVLTGGLSITSYTVSSIVMSPSPLGSATPSRTLNALSIAVSNLTPGATYTFTVHANNAAGAGAESAASNSAIIACQAGYSREVSTGQCVATCPDKFFASNGQCDREHMRLQLALAD